VHAAVFRSPCAHHVPDYTAQALRASAFVFLSTFLIRQEKEYHTNHKAFASTEARKTRDRVGFGLTLRKVFWDVRNCWGLCEEGAPFKTFS
jgi:hypothetical protein